MERSVYEMTYKSNFLKNKEFSFGGIQPDEETAQESDEYKQVFSTAEAYLNRCLPNPSGVCPYPVLRNFGKIVQDNRKAGISNTWGQLASVFFLLSWYALRILRSPWRKSYHKVKIYSGQYHHALNSTFPPDVAERLMEKLGYIHHKQKQTFFFHQQSLTSSGAWRESLMQAGMDFFLVHVRCSLASTEKGRSIEVDILRSSLTCSSSAAAIGLENPPSHSHFAAPPVKEIMTRSGGARNAHSQPLQKLHPIAVKPPPQFYSGQAVARGIVPNRIGRDAFAESRTSAFHRPSSRVETPPDDRPLENQYVYVTPLPSGGESSKSQVPWGHRLSKSNVEAGRRQRDAKLMSQTSEDHGDLYGATGPADCSVQDEAIRYPPADPLFTIPPKQISGPSDEPLAFTVRGLKLDGPGSKARSCYPPDVNYVSFLPNNLSGNRRPVKAEPSYPPDHSGSRPASRFERHNTPLSYLAMSSSSEPGGSRDVPRAGEYVHIQPPKRPGEVRHEQQQTQQKHIYHEIQDEGWSGSSLARPPASSGFRK